jgi:ABC-type transporter Mla subunit MlaD
MNARRREQGVFANPILIGALTVLATIVAVTLAYQANNGLPFVPKYALHVQIADAAELTHGTEVHEGGALVGLVDSVTPSRDASGAPLAVLNLSLNKNVEPLPVDSAFDVRLKGSIGLKYLQITPGQSRQAYANGATVPATQSGSEVDLDQVLSMFDPPTRTAVANATVGFSDALTGRGSDINDAIGAFVPLVTDLGPVARNLASPKTSLGGFFRGLESFAGALAPVAQTQANLYVNLDTTFGALAPVAVPFVEQWIAQTPPAFNSVITDSPAEQTFLSDTASLFKELRPGFATLPASAPVLADAFAEGARNLPGTAALDQRTVSLSDKLASFGENLTVQRGLDRLALTGSSLRPPLAFLTPAQTTCNYVTLFLRNISSVLSDQVGAGTAFRFSIVAIDDLPGEESVPSSHLYTVPDTSSNPADQHGPVHANPYPNTDAPGQTPSECAAGNEPYSGAQALTTNPPGALGLKTETTTRPKQ